MQVADRFQDLPDVRGRQGLAEPFRAHDPVKEFASSAQLDDKVDVLLITEGLVQPCDVGVVQGFGHRDLTLKVGQVLDGLEAHALHGALHAALPAGGPADAAEGALAQALAVELVEGVQLPGVLLRERVREGRRHGHGVRGVPALGVRLLHGPVPRGAAAGGRHAQQVAWGPGSAHVLREEGGLWHCPSVRVRGVVNRLPGLPADVLPGNERGS
mmetsp:Transcript_31788/g.91404  ORF Transcript_31788/g.91404 Transcript_31788/m.91404 type:complete len:214 (+) Transcript_31788:1189-1830(+)